MDSAVVLSGGSGGAKLARGLADACEQLTVVANTGDDVDIYGVHVWGPPALKDVKRRLFFFHDRLFDILFPVVSDFGFHFALRDRRSLFL